MAAAFARGIDAGGVSLNAPALLEGAVHAALRDPDANSLELRERAPARSANGSMNDRSS